MSSNSLQLLKEMAKSGECVTILPANAAISELESGALMGIPIATAALENTTLCLITRLGRQLPAVANRLLGAVETNLRKWASGSLLLPELMSI
ncbi:MAG: LysR substrate-binding domain-containing protein [Caulobacteraceae bacterium]